MATNSNTEQRTIVVSSWSDLPTDLLSEIARRIERRIYILRFRAVCRSWRSSCAPLIPYHHAANDNRIFLSSIFPNKYFPYFFLESSICVFEKPMRGICNDPKYKYWLAIVDEKFNHPGGKFSLRSSLSVNSFKNNILPDGFPNGLNSSNFRVTEVSRFVTFCDRYSPCRYIQKVVLLFQNGSSGNSFKDSSAEVVAMMLLAYGNLLVYRFIIDQFQCSRGDAAATENLINFHDIVNYKGKACVVDYQGRAYTIEYNESLLMTNISSEVIQNCGHRSRLVESSGDLYLLVMRNREEEISSSRLDVYKLKEEESRWIRVHSLGDLALYVGDDFSFAISTQEFKGGLRGNCVFVSFNAFRDNGVHSFGQQKKPAVYCFNLSESVRAAKDASNIFCPPSAWL